MLKVGLTGGLATGKTYVGKLLVEMGCHLVEADQLGHRVLEREGEAYAAVVAEFGGGILEENGSISRKRLATEVFDRPERLARLNALVHPAVFRLQEQWMNDVEARDPHGIAVVEAAILIETGSYRRFEKLILTVCEESQQIERAVRRDGMTEEQARARLQRQMPLAEKRKFADYVIDTSGAKESTLEQTRAVYDSLRRISV